MFLSEIMPLNKITNLLRLHTHSSFNLIHCIAFKKKFYYQFTRIVFDDNKTEKRNILE